MKESGIKNFIINYFLGLGACIFANYLCFFISGTIKSDRIFDNLINLYAYTIPYAFLILTLIHLVSKLLKKNIYQDLIKIIFINITIITISALLNVPNFILFIGLSILIIFLYSFLEIKFIPKLQKTKDFFINFFILNGANGFTFLLLGFIGSACSGQHSILYFFSLILTLLLGTKIIYTSLIITIAFYIFSRYINQKHLQDKSYLIIFGLIYGLIFFAINFFFMDFYFSHLEIITTSLLLIYGLILKYLNPKTIKLSFKDFLKIYLFSFIAIFLPPFLLILLVNPQDFITETEAITLSIVLFQPLILFITSAIFLVANFINKKLLNKKHLVFINLIITILLYSTVRHFNITILITFFLASIIIIIFYAFMLKLLNKPNY